MHSAALYVWDGKLFKWNHVWNMKKTHTQKNANQQTIIMNEML